MVCSAVTAIVCTPICCFELQDQDQHNFSIESKKVLIPLHLFSTTGALVFLYALQSPLVFPWYQFILY